MSKGYNTQHVGPVTAPIPTGATSIELHTSRSPRVDGVRAGFQATFGGYVPPEWTLDAECTRPGVDPGAFYPEKGGRRDRTSEAALALCNNVCTVREKCLEEALAFEVGDVGAADVRPDVFGIRGGLTSKDRHKLVQKIRVERMEETRRGVVAAYLDGDEVEEIAEKFGVHENTPAKWARVDGHPIRRAGGPGKKRSQRSGDSQKAILGPKRARRDEGGAA